MVEDKRAPGKKVLPPVDMEDAERGQNANRASIGGRLAGLMLRLKNAQRGLSVETQDGGRFDCGEMTEPDRARQLEYYASDLARAIKEREEVTEKLNESRLESLLCLAAAAEYRDEDTGEHITRMGHISAVLAKAMGENDRYCNDMLYASRLHDVGKIGIPDAILQKPGKLEEDEWAVMRQHPVIGHKLLGNCTDCKLSGLFTMAGEIALTHHEKYDGSGYPYGLRGEAIPLSGRIVAVADFFDAVTMDRCYRRAMSDQQAHELLREGAGSHFDPEVVDAFFRARDEIHETRERVNSGAMA